MQDVEAIEFLTEPDTVVILHSAPGPHVEKLRASEDISLQHVSTRGAFALISWVLDGGPSTVRGWSGSISRTFGASAPAVKELQEWSQERMEELAARHAGRQLEALPRDWERMVRHSYFSGVPWPLKEPQRASKSIIEERIPIAVTGEAGHHAITNDTRMWWSVPRYWGSMMLVARPWLVGPTWSWRSLLRVARWKGVRRESRGWEHDKFYDPDPNCWMRSRMEFSAGPALREMPHLRPLHP